MTPSTSHSLDASEEELWNKVEEYIRNCPHVSTTEQPQPHPAIQAALKGIEQERKRRERDAKLQEKFAASAATSCEPTNTIAPASQPNNESTMKNTNNHNTMNEDDDDMLTDDWEDVNAEQKGSQVPADGDGGTSFLGDRLASETVLLIARHKVQVSSPVAALAAAFHGALLSSSSSSSNTNGTSSLGFVCTGVPHEGPSTGFAPPVRALPSNQFLPPKWDENKNRVVLRYRQNGVGGSVGSVVLTVELQAVVNNNNSDSAEVKVTWTPTKQASSLEEPTLTFALGDHINLDSWNHASQNSTVKIAPSLHYKALASLLTLWVQTCDLGNAMMAQDDAAGGVANKEEQHQQLYVDATIQQLPSQQQPRAIPASTVTSEPQPVLPQYPGGRPSITTGPRGYEVPSTLQDAFPGAHRGGLGVPGQFSGDLFPGGVNGGGGNLMGPNHPAFGGPPNGAGGYLQPRYDPFGPPPTDPEQNGVPPGPGHGPRGGPPRRNLGGTPNNDHFRPPNNLNNNMFL